MPTTLALAGFVTSTMCMPLRYEPNRPYDLPPIFVNSWSVPKFGTSPLRASYGMFFTYVMFGL